MSIDTALENIRALLLRSDCPERNANLLVLFARGLCQVRRGEENNEHSLDEVAAVQVKGRAQQA